MDQRIAIKKIPFFLITGFLGSGKTSLLKNLLLRYAQQYRIAIVQNEFAPGHIDKQLLKESTRDFKLLEINNGSVFCACLLSDFIDRLQQFLSEVKPDIIFLEATGLADPVSLAEILQSPKVIDYMYLAGSWCVVDARNFFPMVDQVRRIRHQVRIADLIWLNKTDLVTDLTEIEKRIKLLNPFANIVTTAFGETTKVDLHAYLKTLVNEPHTLVTYNTESEPRPDIGACVVRSNKYFKQDLIKGFIENQAKTLYRMKGYIRINENETLAIQTVFRDIQIDQASDYEGATELIAIGPGLIPREFSKEFLAMKNT